MTGQETVDLVKDSFNKFLWNKALQDKPSRSSKETINRATGSEMCASSKGTEKMCNWIRNRGHPKELTNNWVRKLGHPNELNDKMCHWIRNLSHRGHPIQRN